MLLFLIPFFFSFNSEENHRTAEDWPKKGKNTKNLQGIYTNTRREENNNNNKAARTSFLCFHVFECCTTPSLSSSPVAVCRRCSSGIFALKPRCVKKKNTEQDISLCLCIWIWRGGILRACLLCTVSERVESTDWGLRGEVRERVRVYVRGRGFQLSTSYWIRFLTFSGNSGMTQRCMLPVFSGSSPPVLKFHRIK